MVQTLIAVLQETLLGKPLLL